MELTTEVVARFVGGQLEVQNQNQGYLYRGEIATIVIEGGTLKVTFVWLAKGEGYPPLPERWVNDNDLTYAASLEIYPASDIGPSGPEIGGDNRICLTSPIVGEMVVLYPPNGSKLDPAEVAGLTLPQE